MDRGELVVRLFKTSTDVRVRSDPDMANASRIVECLALMILQEREQEVLDLLVPLLWERGEGRTEPI